MCSLASIDQNRILPSFEPATESSFSLYVPYSDLGKEEFLDSPFFSPLHATMVPFPACFSEENDKDGCEPFALAALAQKNGMQDLPYSAEPVSTRQLFKEITAKGYRGTIGAMQIFLSTIRKNKNKSPEAYLDFHKDYLKKRATQDAHTPASIKQLFQEIKVKGYRGSISGVRSFISSVRSKKNRAPEASLQFHKEYIKKRLKESVSESVSLRQLFKEIQENGYLGAYNTVVKFVSLIRESKRPEASFQFHKEYIKKRVEKAAPESISPRKLFEEIRANGYLGAYSTVVTFISLLRGRKGPEASLEFHKEYIQQRVEEAASKYVLPMQLFEEIKAKGYQGTLRTVQTFVSMIHTIRLPGASLEFHKEYIQQRVEKSAPGSVSIRKLFEEIRANGYLGSYNTVRAFLSTIREKKNKRTEESLHFHKEYIQKRLVDAVSECVSPKQLFEEIKANGYLGKYNTVKAFVSTIREKKNKRAEASFQFHKEYIEKRLEEAAPKSVSTKELFEEIKAKGYQGTLKTIQMFLSTIRASRPPEALLRFHKEYIRKRIEETSSESVPLKQLFEEIKAKGYQGTPQLVKTFVSMIRTSRSPRESLQFHKEYIKKRIGEAAPEYVSTTQLFEEIKANGYAGAYNTVKVFASKTRKMRSPEQSLEFYKDFLSKRLEGEDINQASR